MSEVATQNNHKMCLGFDKTIEVDSLAKAYVPFQKICKIYSGCESLVKGTVFPELDKPYKKEGKWNE